MILVLGLVLVYLISSLPGISYALNLIKESKPVIRFKLNEKVKVLQYMEFYQILYVGIYELLKIIVLIIVLRSDNYLLMLAFILGLVFPIWMRFKQREMGIFPLIFIMYLNIWLGILFALVQIYELIKKGKTNPLVVLGFLGVALLLFWVLNYDMLIIYQVLTFIGFQMIHLLAGTTKTSEK